MVNAITAMKQTLFNTAIGGFLSLAAGTIGTHVVRFIQGQSFHEIPATHPLITCTKVAAISMPLWYLYQQYGEEYCANALRPSAYEILFSASALAILKFTDTKVTPLLSLALVLTHLSWKIFASTDRGSEILGIDRYSF